MIKENFQDIIVNVNNEEVLILEENITAPLTVVERRINNNDTSGGWQKYFDKWSNEERL